MNKKPEILVAPKDIAEMKLLAEAGADAFIVGTEKFMIYGRGYFSDTDLAKVAALAHQLDKKVYLTIDAIFPNDLLEELAIFLQKVKPMQFDGIRYADLGVYMLIKEVLPDMPLHFVDQMMLTNYETLNYWAKRGLQRLRIAPELTLEEVLEIKSKAACEVEVLIQGASMMFTSRRKLIENYLDYQESVGKGVIISKDQNTLYDPDRKLFYPIIENTHGTHIFSGNDICMIDEMSELLTVGIDAMYIEGFTCDSEKLVQMVKLYKMAADLAVVEPDKYLKIGAALYVEASKLLGENRVMDRGFYYKPTIYKNQSR